MKAYRECEASPQHYPNSAELLRAVIGTSRLSGGITEVNKAKHKELAKAWCGSAIKVAGSSWRTQLGLEDVLGCPEDLDTPWLFSMDPMTYSENSDDDDANLHRSDLCQLADGLRPYFKSEQPGIACLFVYGLGVQNKNPQKQFWAFMDELACRLGVQTCSYWMPHQGGNRNLAGVLFSEIERSDDFDPPNIEVGRGI